MQAVLIQCLIYRGKSNIQLLIYPKLKVQCHEIVCQLRPLTYSLDLNNAPRISFKLVKSCFK
jgi:hypothetical protein